MITEQGRLSAPALFIPLSCPHSLHLLSLSLSGIKFREKNVWSEPRFRWLSLILLVVLFPHLLGFTVQLSEARPLNSNMELEGKKKQSLSSSTFATLVKEQYVPNLGEILGPRGPPIMFATPPHFGNHELSASPRVHGDDQHVTNIGENPSPRGPPVLYTTPPHFGNHEMSAASLRVHGKCVPLAKGPVPPSAPNPVGNN